jgi:hypothetical protein
MPSTISTWIKRASIPIVAAAALGLTGCGDSANNAACQQAHRDAASYARNFVGTLPAQVDPGLEANLRDSQFRLLVIERRLQYCN